MLIYNLRLAAWFQKKANLLTFLDKVADCLDSGENMDVVFLGFAKAFDKVSYRRLEKKLQSWYHWKIVEVDYRMVA